ncbi:hypothetical protein KEM55_001756, partial [Ascosphaera atra]
FLFVFSRHYAKWLLPDARFDGGVNPPLVIPQPAQPVYEGRATRASHDAMRAASARASATPRQQQRSASASASETSATSDPIRKANAAETTIAWVSREFKEKVIPRLSKDAIVRFAVFAVVLTYRALRVAMSVGVVVLG